jgi:dual specificity protein phosphatase 1B
MSDTTTDSVGCAALDRDFAHCAKPAACARARARSISAPSSPREVITLEPTVPPSSLSHSSSPVLSASATLAISSDDQKVASSDSSVNTSAEQLSNGFTDRMAIVLYEYTAQDPTKEISLQRGSIINVIQMPNSCGVDCTTTTSSSSSQSQSGGGWWRGINEVGEDGWFPQHYVRLLASDDSRARLKKHSKMHRVKSKERIEAEQRKRAEQKKQDDRELFERQKRAIIRFKTALTAVRMKNDKVPAIIYRHGNRQLLLGSIGAAYSRDVLDQTNTTHIVTVAGSIKPMFRDDFKYLHIRVVDAPSAQLRPHFEKCHAFICEALGIDYDVYQDSKCSLSVASEEVDDTESDPQAQVESSVLVHCFAGVSRSSTVIVSWLMRYLNMRVMEALHYVRERRPVANPNSGFMAQLLEYEAELF